MRVTSGRLVRFVAAAELPVLLAIAPLLLFPTPGRLVALAVVPIVWLCARITTGRFIPATPINAALGLLLAMVGVSLFATTDVRFSLGKVAGTLLGALLFWAIARWLTTPDRLKLATAVFVFAGGVLAVVGILGVTEEGKSGAIGSLMAQLPIRIRGVPGAERGFNPNPVAGCLVLFVPLQAALLATGAHRWLLPGGGIPGIGKAMVGIQALLLCLTAGTVLLMRSRGASWGLMAAIIVFFICQSRRVRLVAAVTGVVVVVLLLGLGPRAFLRQVIVFSGPGEAESRLFVMEHTVASRVDLWSRAVAGIRDYPVTGMGMNMFRKIMPVRYPVSRADYEADVPHAHNNVLQAALDLGIPGLVAYLWLWLVAGALLVGVYRRATDRLYRAMAGGIGIGLLAHFLFGIADAIPLGAKVGVLFWLTLALTVSLHRVALEQRPN